MYSADKIVQKARVDESLQKAALFAKKLKYAQGSLAKGLHPAACSDPPSKMQHLKTSIAYLHMK